MKLPLAPASDENTERHSFYGGIATALETLSEKIGLNSDAVRDSRRTDKEHFDELRQSVEELHIRINKRTYREDTVSLETRIKTVESEQKASHSAWVTGKTFVFGAWLVFSIMIGSILTSVVKNFDSYITTIKTNEKMLFDQGHEIEKISDTILVTKTQFTAHDATLGDLLKKINGLEDQVQSQYEKINRVQGDLRKITNKVDENHNGPKPR